MVSEVEPRAANSTDAADKPPSSPLISRFQPGLHLVIDFFNGLQLDLVGAHAARLLLGKAQRARFPFEVKTKVHA